MTTLMITSPAEKKARGATEKGLEREETDLARDGVVGLETEITEDQRMIEGEADLENGNPRSRKNARETGMREKRDQARNSLISINHLKNLKRNIPGGSAMKTR